MREYREARFRFYRHTPEGFVVPTDDPVAKSYIPQARTLLGEVKQQIALGLIEQGMRRVTLDNGVRLEAHSMPGQDEMRISVPISFGDENEPKKEPKPEETMPFLWVGARVAWDQTNTSPTITVPWYYPFGMMVCEPGRNGVIGNEWQVWPYIFWGNEVYTLGFGWPTMYPPHVANGSFYNEFSIPIQRNIYNRTVVSGIYNMSMRPPPAGRAPYRLTDIDDNNYFGECLVTDHGLIGREVYWSDGDEDYWMSFGAPPSECLVRFPDDPLSTSGFTRVFPDDFPYPALRTEWDHVVVLDPTPGKGRASSRRTSDRRLVEFIQSQTNVRGRDMVLPGDYVVKLVGIGGSCPTSGEGFPYTNGWNEGLEYPTAVPIEVEVRVDRSGNNLQRSLIWIDKYSEIYPYHAPFHGDDLNGYLPSTHGDNWWQGAILANPRQRTIQVVESTYIPGDLSPDDIFGAAENNNVCHRKPFTIYIAVYSPWALGFIFAGHAAISAEAAEQTYYLIDQARQGVVGFVSLPETTEAEILGIISPVIASNGNGAGVYFYDVEEKTCGVSAYQPAAIWHDSPASELDWNTNIRWDVLRACRMFGLVTLGAGDPLILGYNPSTDPDDIGDLNCWSGL